ncbi:O-antigen ligase family protein [Phenylobacterium sp. 58.2.17]|uniref:O-antigen ligase family protein n=1 Tax=Phenylobacterium sp. 58.2.17 TaxID=2969306 RepID=UPI002264836A|nr:O-antigen ligase family protein [Phenylobacterium sp. 58.2.17]MCX7585414.1 O-antigen ligase family protein [Phenylobacterium sp. 58.2.17]
MWARSDNDGRGSRPIILRPYTRPGPGRLVQAALLLAFMGFCLFFGFFYGLTTPFLIKQLVIPIILLALIAVWALPDVKTAPTGALYGLSFAFLIVLFLWPNYLAVALPGLPWITLMRLVGVPMTLVLIISYSMSPDFRAQMKDSLNATPQVYKLLAGFVLIQVVTIAFSSSKDLSIQRVLNSQLTWTAIYFASAFVFLKPGRVHRWAVILWAVTIIVCLMGLLEFKIGRPSWGAYVPNFLKIEDESVIRSLTGSTRSATGQYRVQSTFSTPLGLAEFLALTAPFILHFVMFGKNLATRIAAGATLPLMLYIVIVTDSRLGMVGFLLSFMLYLLLWSWLRWRADKASLLAPAIVLAYPAIFVLFIAATLVVRRLRNMVWGGGDSAASTEARGTQWEMGIPKILKAPWGHGAGTGGDTLGFLSPIGIQTIDTYYLTIGLEYGVIGFVVYYGMLVASTYYAAKYAVRSPKGELSYFMPAAIALVNFIVIKSVFSQQDNHPLIFMLMGIVTAMVYRATRENPDVAARTGA